MSIFKSRQQRLEEARGIISDRQIFEKEQKLLKQAGGRSGEAIGRSVAQFGRSGRQPIDMSFEQECLLEIMSGGRRNQTWGTGNNLPQINHDLMPRMRDNRIDGTASLFGFGSGGGSVFRNDNQTRSMFGVGKNI